MAYTGSVPNTAAHRDDWMERAACRHRDPGLFSDGNREHEARTVCVAHCPVRAECLAYVKRTERGLHRDQRDGVVAGLTYCERFRLDPTAQRREDDPPLITFGGTERCGTHIMLLRHLWLGEPIDGRCWSGQVFRDRDNRSTRQRGGSPPEPAAAPEARPEPAAAPRPAQSPAATAQAQPRGSTAKERHVYRLWAQGLDDAVIARRADLSLPAVRRVREALGLLPNLPLGKAS